MDLMYLGGFVLYLVVGTALIIFAAGWGLKRHTMGLVYGTDDLKFEVCARKGKFRVCRNPVGKFEVHKRGFLEWKPLATRYDLGSGAGEWMEPRQFDKLEDALSRMEKDAT